MLNNLSDDYKLKLQAIKNHFGVDAQYKKLVEEMKELRESLQNIVPIRYKKSYAELTDFLYHQWDVYNNGVLSEIADCCVVAYQLDETEFLINYIEDSDTAIARLIYQNFKNSKSKILEIARFKIDRTIQRYGIKTEGCDCIDS